MGMASVSPLYLFNIQVRANCTTACNIQAALQYVELTHISSSVSLFFFCICFVVQKKIIIIILKKKHVHAAWNGFRSHAGPLHPMRGARRPNRGWSTGGCWRPDGSAPIGYVSHSQRRAGQTASASSFPFARLFPRQKLKETIEGFVSLSFLFFFCQKV